MLHYNADHMVRDRSGVPLIRYHREQVGDQEIIALLEQACESRKPVNGTRNNIEPVVNEKTDEQKRVEDARRAEEARRVEVVRRAEEVREAEAAREEAKRQAQVESQRKMETQKNKLISEIAEGMTDAIIMKLLVSGLIKSLTSGYLQYPVSYVQNIKTRASNIIVLQKELEDRLGEKVAVAVAELLLKPAQAEVALDKIDSYAQGIQSELEVILKDEISHLSLGALKRKLRKVQRQSLKFSEMVAQVLPFKEFREGFIQRLAKEFDRYQIPRPASISDFLTGDLSDITFPE